MKGYHAYNLGERLIPLNEEEVATLIKDRKRRLSFLEESAQRLALCRSDEIQELDNHFLSSDELQKAEKKGSLKHNIMDYYNYPEGKFL